MNLESGVWVQRLKVLRLQHLYLFFLVLLLCIFSALINGVGSTILVLFGGGFSDVGSCKLVVGETFVSTFSLGASTLFSSGTTSSWIGFWGVISFGAGTALDDFKIDIISYNGFIGDINTDSVINVLDIVLLINFILDGLQII